MRKPKFDRAVYQALANAGMNNREIAEHLRVDEASVRRGLKEPERPDAARSLYVMAEILDSLAQDLRDQARAIQPD